MIGFWIMAAIAICLALFNWLQHTARAEAQEIAVGLVRRLRRSRSRERAAIEVVHMIRAIKEVHEDPHLLDSLEKFTDLMRETALDELRHDLKTEDPLISIKIDDLLRRTDL